MKGMRQIKGLFTLITHYLGDYKKTIVFAPIFVLIETAASLIMPTLIARLINEGVTPAIESGGANPETIRVMIMCGLMMTGLALISFICGITAGRLTTKSANGFGSRLRVAMYHHMQEFSFADVDKFSTASLITRLTGDVRTLQMSLQMGIRTLIQAPFQLIIAFALVIGYSAKLALIYLIAIPFLAVTVLTIQRTLRNRFTIMREKVDGLNAAVQENLISIRVVKSFVREDYEDQKFKVINEDMTRTNIGTMSRMQLMQPLTMLIVNATVITIYWVGGQMVGNGVLLRGELVAVIQYMMQIMFSIMQFSMVYMQVSRALACVERISEVLETEADIQDADLPAVFDSDIIEGMPLDPNRPVVHRADMGRVEFENVDFKYYRTGTGDDVLKNLSFTVEPGETVAIVGNTGSGKSSLVNLIPRFYDVTGGSIKVNGVDVRDYNISDLRDSIGMVLQKNVLFSGTIRENMLWGKEDATDEEIIEALRNAQAYKFVMEEFPGGLDSEVLQGGTNLSGGQKQRLCIARAMLRNPSILILDDSTSAVDSDTESKIRATFNEGLSGCTVFIIAQRISSVIGADKILVLEDGAIEALGTHSELMASSGVYKEIYTSQQEGGGLSNV